ncbi:hypothetical protein [Ilumatobacter sp.]|uniref:hypothetical protein n=1 Tax=Ilumatobacter sp. TaxID=1967498 RepID=UPI003B52CAFF
MSDLTDDQIRELMERAMAHAPEPHPWEDVRRRGAAHDDPAAVPVHRRSWVWLAAAACAIALVAGFVVLTESDGDRIRVIDEPVPTAPTTPETTTAPTTTDVPTTTTSVPEVESAGWSGGLLDDLDTESLRPLDGYADGDAIIPTGPGGWRVESSRWGTGEGPASTEWYVSVTNAPPDRGFEEQLLQVMSTDEPCGFTRLCRRTGEAVTIDGVVWKSLVPDGVEEGTDEFVANMSLRAGVGDRWVFLALANSQVLDGTPFEEPEVIEFLEDLRVGSPEVLMPIGEACWQCGVAGAEGDPFAATESPTAAPTTTSDGAQTPTSEPGAQTPDRIGSETGRPLAELVDGDVVFPTYIPPGLTLRPEAQISEQPGLSEFSVTLEAADGEHSASIRLWQEGGPIGPAPSDDPNHPRVEVAGLTWEWNDFESARITYVGSFSVWVYLHGLDRSEAERFIEGLRAIPIEQFPNPIASDSPDGLSVTDNNNTDGAEIVATDDEFELTAVRVSDQVCTKLEQTTDPVTMTFAANCWDSERLADSGIVDFVPVDLTDTEHLIIAILDSSNAMSVRITSPDGESVVVPTGPANQAIDGRFFLARLILDVSDGIRLDQFTIEDASP